MRVLFLIVWAGFYFGHAGSASRMLGELRRNPKLGKRLNELERL